MIFLARRALLGPLVLVLVPLTLLRMTWRLLLGPDPARVVNGVLVLPPSGSVEAVVTVVGWAWAVTAGVIVLRGGDRPLRRAMPLLPTVLGALAAASAVLFSALLLLGLALPADAAVVAVLAVLLAAAASPILVRLALVLPVAVAEGVRGGAAFGRAWALARHGGMVRSALILALGVVAPAALAGWVFRRAEAMVTGVPAGLARWLLEDLILIAVAAVQATNLLALYREIPPVREVASPVRSDDGPNVRRTRLRMVALPLALAAVLLPTAVVGAVVSSERLPELSVQRQERLGRVMALGWPAGRHPVIVGQTAIHDCTDDRCSGLRTTELSVTVYHPSGDAVIAPDGSVYALGQHELEHCDPQRRCRRAAGRLEALAGSRWETIGLSPDGEILIATAKPVGSADAANGSQPGRQMPIDLRLLRCPDVFCTQPKIVRFGQIQVFAGRESDRVPHLVLAVGTDRTGRPVLAFRSPFTGMAWVGRCETSACATTQLAILAHPRPPGLPTEEELALLHFDGVLTCVKDDGCGSTEPTATVDRPGGGMYGVALGYAPTRGVRIQVGEPPSPRRRAVLWSCADYRCNSPSKTQVVDLPQTYTALSDLFDPADDERWLLAANPDGRVVLAPVFPDRIVVVRPRA